MGNDNPLDRIGLLNAFLSSEDQRPEAAIFTATQAITHGIMEPGKRPYWDNRYELFAAMAGLYRHLERDESAFYKDSNLLASFTVLTYALERYPEIPDLLQRLQKAQPTDLSRIVSFGYPNLASDTRENLSLPRFMLDYKTRTEQGWAAVAALLKEIDMEKLRAADGAKQFSKLSARIFLTIAAFTGLRVVVLPPTEELHKLIICFSLDNCYADLHATHYVVDKMPQDLDDKVVLAFGDPSTPAEDIPALLDQFPNLRDVHYTLRDSPGHLGVLVEAYIPGLKSKEAALRKQEIHDALIGLLSRDTCNLTIFDVAIRNKPFPPKSAISFEQIPRALQNMNYPLTVSDEAFIKAVGRQYANTPSKKTALREDIVSGSLFQYYLQADYQDRRTGAADILITLGVVPCFLAWPLSILQEGDKDTLDNRFASYLEEREKGDYSAAIIGNATGTRYYYMDLLVWSLSRFVKALETFLADFPGGDQVILQCFRYGSKPGPATVERLERFSDTAGEASLSFQQNMHHPPAKKSGKKRKK